MKTNEETGNAPVQNANTLTPAREKELRAMAYDLATATCPAKLEELSQQGIKLSDEEQHYLRALMYGVSIGHKVAIDSGIARLIDIPARPQYGPDIARLNPQDSSRYEGETL